MVSLTSDIFPKDNRMKAPVCRNDGRTPLFSIVIPVYNAGRYLRDCLTDILAQDFENWEVIMVDDCSTDNSVLIAEEFCSSDSRIRLFKSEKNSGGAHGPRLKAAAFSSGTYIVTIDADDRVSPDLLRKLFVNIQFSNPDLVVSEMWSYDGHSSTKILPLDYIDVSKVWSGRELVEHTLNRWAFSMAGFAVRREIYLDADRYVTYGDRLSIFSDEIHSRWVLVNCKVVTMTDGRYYYRKNDESVTHKDSTRYIESKLISTESLLSMTESTFGAESSTYLKAVENRFFTLVEILRLLNRPGFEDRRKKKLYVKKVSEAMKRLDTGVLKGRISPRYLALMSLPIPMARIGLKLIDSVVRR